MDDLGEGIHRRLATVPAGIVQQNNISAQVLIGHALLPRDHPRHNGIGRVPGSQSSGSMDSPISR